MSDLRSKDQAAFYTCGKCKGRIRYVIADGIPDECPECGYSHKVHGSRSVDDIPDEIKYDLNQGE